jgi:hypothetical protein
MSQEKTVPVYDVRVMDRMIKKGELTAEERDRYLGKLPDVADKAADDEDDADKD